MATTTTNLGLTKPGGSDKIRIAQINGNMDIIDAKLGPVGNTSLQAQATALQNLINAFPEELGIVVTGNKTASGVTAAIGQYVILKGSTISGKADGLYKAAKAIPANTVINGTYLTEVSKGGLNDLRSGVTAGTNVTGESISVESGQTVTLQTITLGENDPEGIYLVNVRVKFGDHTATTGVKIVMISSSENITSLTLTNGVMASGAAQVQLFNVFSLTSSTTYYIRVRHTNGSTLSCQSTYKLSRIGG